MKITKSYSFINVVGNIWMPQSTAAMTIKLTDWDIKNIIEDETITREDVELWLCTHAGDFSSIKDFYADIELANGKNIIIDWQDEENEFVFNDCMYPAEFEDC